MLETATLIADGQTYFIATELNYAVGNDYAEQGYNYEGMKLYGLRGELAAWLPGKDELHGSSGNDWLEGLPETTSWWVTAAATRWTVALA